MRANAFGQSAQWTQSNMYHKYTPNTIHPDLNALIRRTGTCKKRQICMQELICDACYKTLRLFVSVKKLTSGLVAVFTIVSFQVRVHSLLFLCHHSFANFRAYMCMHRQEVQNKSRKTPMHNIPFILPQAFPSCSILTVFKWVII